jgi:CheY-specific phosphatase CheX
LYNTIPSYTGEYVQHKKNPLKPDIHLNIAIYHIFGEMVSSSVDELLNRIENHLHILRSMHIQGLLFSFENVTKIDKKALLKLIKGLGVFHVKMRARIGLSDYSDKMYKALRALIISSPLGLYKNIDVMSLAVGTSKIASNSGVLVYSHNVDERQLIASTLIANNYFVIMAISNKDLLFKAKDEHRYDSIVHNSYFSNIHEEVAISFDNNIYIYEFQGILDGSIYSRINIDDFKYRLSLGYSVIIFDFTHIYHMNLRAALFLLELEQIASSFSALIGCIGLSNHKIDANALSTLDKANIWLFEDLDHVVEDEEVIKKTQTRLPMFTDGISKKLLELTTHFMSSSIQALNLYELANPKKVPPKQVGINELSIINPSVITHINFSGDYEGEFFFLFEKVSAHTLADNILVGMDKYTMEDYLDAMSEFVNSLTGKLKSNLRKQNKCIQFNLPYSSQNLESFLDVDDVRTFILTAFEYNNKKYYAAISAPIEDLYTTSFS